MASLYSYADGGALNLEQAPVHVRTYTRAKAVTS